MSNKRAYQICNRCVMDTSDEDIVFDASGNCNHCNSALENLQKEMPSPEILQQQWNDILANMKKKGQGKKYDCLMGISGGVDSCYAVYLAVQQGLRPLLMHLDNGWDSEIAVQNIKNLVEKLKLDYISYVIDWQEFREIQLAFLKSSSVDLEYPTDIGILASTHQMAAKHKINYIVSGGNSNAEGILPLTWGYHPMRDMKYYKYIVDNFSSMKLKKVPHIGIYGEAYYKFVKNIRTMYLLNYIDYDKDQARAFLKQEFGWKEYGGKHHESKITAFWQGYVMPTKFNMDYRRATLSSQICAGQVSREDAIIKLTEPPFDAAEMEKLKQYVAKKFGISNSQMDEYLALPPKTYKDFPNSKGFVDFCFGLYRRIFKQKRI